MRILDPGRCLTASAVGWGGMADMNTRPFLYGRLAGVVLPPGELALLHPHLIYLRLRRLLDALVEEAGDVVGDVLQVILDGEVTGIEAVQFSVR